MDLYDSMIKENNQENPFHIIIILPGMAEETTETRLLLPQKVIMIKNYSKGKQISLMNSC